MFQRKYELLMPSVQETAAFNNHLGNAGARPASCYRMGCSLMTPLCVLQLFNAVNTLGQVGNQIGVVLLGVL